MNIPKKIFDLVQKIPDKIAITSRDRELTYRQLEEESNRVANFFTSQRFAEKVRFDSGEKMKEKVDEEKILIFMERSPELITSILGIVKFGGVFVPLDLKYPEERLRMIMNEVQSQWIVLHSKNLDDLERVLEDGEQRLKALVLGDPIPTSRKYHNLELYYLHEELSKEFYVEDLPPHCYLYYTSGSTGVPKGVLGRQKSLLHFIEWEIKELGIDESFRCSQLTPPSFDPYLRDIFVPLLAGGTSYIPEEEIILNPRRLIEWFEKKGINLIHMTPSLFKSMASELDSTDSLPGLNYILLAGEMLRGSDIRRFVELFQDKVQLVNLYGPTETTLAKFFYRIGSNDITRINIPVGKPLPLTEALILNEDGKRCDLGTIGEVYIRTPFISSGYYKRMELTKEVFIRNPFSDNPRDILYKTGDLGRILPDGNLELVGRVDHQVKIRGVRIEPQEIENKLLRYSGIREAIVLARETVGGEKYLCGYILSHEEISVEILRNYLAKELPPYMIPSHFIRVGEIPLTPNGKVDRKALLQMEGRLTTGEYLPPTNEIEEKLVKIWEQALELDRVGIKEGFLDLGGHSLKAISVMAKIYKEFDLELPVNELLKNPDIEALGKIIAVTKEFGYKNFHQPYTIFNGDRERNVFCFPPLVGYGVTYKGLADLIPTHRFYAFDFLEEGDLIRQYVEIILREQEQGPYALLGFSAGGALAFEVAEVMMDEGHQVSDLVLIDSSLNVEEEEISSDEVEMMIDGLLSKVTDQQIKEFMQIESVNQQIRGKMRRYIEYRNKGVGVKVIDAKIHLIKEDNGECDRKRTDWSRSTVGGYCEYQGAGTHEEMLDGEYLKVNARIVGEVLGE